MFKITAIVSLMLIGSTLWAAGLSCDSCGSECASACGTRHFRSCCFNYLRKKRGSDDFKTWWQPPQNTKLQLPELKSKVPVYVIEYVPEQSTYDFKPYPYDDMADNRMHVFNDN